jgi:hypothetical protein
MKHTFVHRTKYRTDADDTVSIAVSPRAVRGALVDASPTVAPAQRWRQLQQRIETYHMQQAIVQQCASDVAAYYLCVFMRPRYSVLAPIM